MATFKQGKSGNPTGKNASKFGEMIRNHPKTLDLVQKVFDIALDDLHKNQMRAMSILMDRIAPQLKASELKIEGDGLRTGVIVLPEKLVHIDTEQGRGEADIIVKEPRADA
jgi:hypothetical protein